MNKAITYNHEIITNRKIGDLQSSDINLIRDHQQISRRQTVVH